MEIQCARRQFLMTERSGANYQNQKTLFEQVNALAMRRDILSTLNLSPRWSSRWLPHSTDR